MCFLTNIPAGMPRLWVKNIVSATIRFNGQGMGCRNLDFVSTLTGPL